MYRAYCEFRQRRQRRKDQARWRGDFVHGLLRARILAAALAPAACVFPTGSSTGLEFTWRFEEQAVDPGRGRTCAGALTETVEISVTDVEDPARATRREFTCAGGHDDAREMYTGLSEAFFDVRPGTYAVELTGRAGGGAALTRAAFEVILEHGVTLTPVTLSPDPVAVVLDIRGSQACATAALTLAVADPGRDLVDGSDEPPYGAGLETADGLDLGGGARTCEDIGDGPQRVEAVDPGSYTLTLTVDDESCARPLAITGDTLVAVDLARPPCQGTP